MLGGKDELPNPFNLIWHEQSEKLPGRPVGTGGLVTLASCVVDNVVKPEREFQRYPVLGFDGASVKVIEAFDDVFEIVVSPMRFAVGTDERVVQI
jgi:hypothetical protein